MYCKHCGSRLDDDARFCPNCGASVQKEESEFTATELPKAAYEPIEEKPAKVWSVFALLGKILGIVCFVASFIPWINWISLEVGVIGIVFSCLGRKAKTEEADSNCSTGLKFSIAAVILSLILGIVYYVLFLGALADAVGGFY